ncbi:hypothetical protein Tco_0419177 [Tanacetum coccineum]
MRYALTLLMVTVRLKSFSPLNSRISAKGESIAFYLKCLRTLGSMEVNLLDEEVSLAMDSLDSLVRGLGAVSKLCKSNLDVH